MLLTASQIVFQIVASNNFPNIFKNCFQNRFPSNVSKWTLCFKEIFLIRSRFRKNFFTISKSSRTLSSTHTYLTMSFQGKTFSKVNYPSRMLTIDIVMLMFALSTMRLSLSWIYISVKEDVSASWSTLSQHMDFLDFCIICPIRSLFHSFLGEVNLLDISFPVLIPPSWSQPLHSKCYANVSSKPNLLEEVDPSILNATGMSLRSLTPTILDI